MKFIFVCFGTPPILKFSQWPFRNRFCFGCSFKQKKVVHFWKKYFRFFSCTGLISHQWLDFCLACSGPAACLQRAQGVKSSLICCSCHIDSIKKYLWWKKLHLKSPKMGPTWPWNLCAKTAKSAKISANGCLWDEKFPQKGQKLKLWMITNYFILL